MDNSTDPTTEAEWIIHDAEILNHNHTHPRAGWAEAMEAAYNRGELELTQEDIDWLDAKLLPDELPDEWEIFAP